MRKVLSLVLVIALIATISGCGSQTPQSPQTPTNVEPAKKIDFTIFTGSQGGGYAAAGAMFNEQWEKNISGFRGSTVAGGSLTNVVNVEKSTDPNVMGLAFNTVLYDGTQHAGDFATQLSGPTKNVSAMVRLNRQSLFLAPVLKDKIPDGVTTMGQYLATKPKVRLFTKDRGTGGEIATRKLLEAYGLSYEIIESWGGKVTYSSTSDGVGAVVNGHADAVWQTYVPHAADLQELESAREVVYLQIEDEIVQKLVESGGYLELEAPADWFKDKISVSTFMEDTVVFTHKDADEEIIYQTTKIILENKQRWENGQKAFESFEPENAWKGTIVPLHPGAERAFKELGYMK